MVILYVVLLRHPSAVWGVVFLLFCSEWATARGTGAGCYLSPRFRFVVAQLCGFTMVVVGTMHPPHSECGGRGIFVEHPEVAIDTSPFVLSLPAGFAFWWGLGFFIQNSTPARQGCLHRFTGAGRRLVTKKPRARGENPPGICEARCLSRLRRALRFSRRVPLARGMSDNESSRCFVRSSSLFYLRGSDPLREGFPMEGAEYGRLGALGAFEAVRRGFLQPPLSLTTCTPRGGRDPLEEMFGDKSTAGTDMTCQILFDQFLDVSAVLRACCASVHSFLVWVCLGKRLLGYPTIA
ncbi:hypothetical protein PAPYR_7098 [Paratrimastix pyriformis]|uniref:Secreted protein n=1 Tax=Paratrimastix pyriformis TaxID=342808 RepID=A0ABQ8UJE1_9EUKA|nr:hypothetical protein PAPYR_7098 [Paratrimastix pyriformis]